MCPRSQTHTIVTTWNSKKGSWHRSLTCWGELGDVLFPLGHLCPYSPCDIKDSISSSRNFKDQLLAHWCFRPCFFKIPARLCHAFLLVPSLSCSPWDGLVFDFSLKKPSLCSALRFHSGRLHLEQSLFITLRVPAHSSVRMSKSQKIPLT